jgi:hypothetical protein
VRKKQFLYFLLEKIAEKDTIGAVVRVKPRNFVKVSGSENPRVASGFYRQKKFSCIKARLGF